MTSADFSAVPELFVNFKVYFPLSLLIARRIVNKVLRSYLSMVILKINDNYIYVSINIDFLQINSYIFFFKRFISI